jgi:5-methylcytosine-specific restriction endonuclease McrA
MINSTTKTCNKCKETKDLAGFCNDKSRKDGLSYQCKDCRKAYAQANTERIAETAHQYYLANKEAMNATSRQYALTHKVELALSKQQYRLAHKEEAANYQLQYNLTHKVEKAAKSLQYRSSRKDIISERGRTYYISHKEEATEYQRQYSLTHKEQAAASSRAWQIANPHKIALSGARRRALKLSNESFEIRPKFLRRLYSSPCVACGTRDNISADHILALHRGGRNSEGNLQPLCTPCNSSKRAKYMIEFKMARPDLFKSKTTVVES